VLRSEFLMGILRPGQKLRMVELAQRWGVKAVGGPHTASAAAR
jgi:hypothetical protein